MFLSVKAKGCSPLLHNQMRSSFCWFHSDDPHSESETPEMKTDITVSASTAEVHFKVTLERLNISYIVYKAVKERPAVTLHLEEMILFFS